MDFWVDRCELFSAAILRYAVTMLTFLQAIILGALQGVTELFPISSLGHSILLPAILGWRISQNANDFLEFLVTTHLATALVLFFFFWKDWKKIITGMLISLK